MELKRFLLIFMAAAFVDSQDDCAVCSKSSCSEKGLSSNRDGVCGESDGAGLGGCSGPQSFPSAIEFCEMADLRLCTAEELLGNAASNTGCGYDNRLIWSSTPCDDGHFFAVLGENGSSMQCINPLIGTQIRVRCCGDENVTTPPCCAADTDLLVRSDGRCGPSFPSPLGGIGQCHGNGTFPCCSPSGWCGDSDGHCACPECVDYREMPMPTLVPPPIGPPTPSNRTVRADGRCGPLFLAPSGGIGECDPTSDLFCCSSGGWCGNSDAHCNCRECVNYREGPGMPTAAPTPRPLPPSGVDEWEFFDFYDFRALSVQDKVTLPDGVFDTLRSSSWYQDPTTWELYPRVLPRGFSPGNVYIVEDGMGSNALALRCLGSPIIDEMTIVRGGEITTIGNNIQFGEFTMFAKAPSLPGTKFGFEYFRDNENQITIEFIIKDLDEGNPVDGWPVVLVILPSWKTVHYMPFDPRTGYHQYRIQWYPDMVIFSFDGGSQAVVTSDDTTIPQGGGTILMNNWSNGVELFVGRPPMEDSIALVRTWRLYYNISGPPTDGHLPPDETTGTIPTLLRHRVDLF